MEQETNTNRIDALEKRMTDSENRERLESKELTAVAVELRENRRVVTDMDGKLDVALEYIAEQKGKEVQNRTFYSLGGGLISSIVTYYLTKFGGGGH